MQAALISMRSSRRLAVIVARPRSVSPRFLSALNDECRKKPDGVNSCHPKSIVDSSRGPPVHFYRRSSQTPMGPTGEGVIPSMREVHLEYVRYVDATGRVKAPSAAHSKKPSSKPLLIPMFGVEDTISFVPRETTSATQPRKSTQHSKSDRPKKDTAISRPPPLTNADGNVASTDIMSRIGQLGPTGSRSYASGPQPRDPPYPLDPLQHSRKAAARGEAAKENLRGPRHPSADELPDGVESIMAAVKKSGKSAGEETKSMVDRVADVAEQTAQVGRDSLSRVAEVGKDVLASIGGTGIRAAESAVHMGKEGIKTVASKSLDAAETLVQASKEKLHDAAQTTRIVAKTAAAVGQEKAADVADATRNAVEAGKEKAQDVAHKTKETVVAGKDKAAETAKNVYETTKDTAESAVQTGKQKAGDMAEKGKEMWEAGKAKVKSAAEETKGKAADMAETAKDRASSVKESVKDKVANVAETAKDKVGYAAERAKDKAEHAADKVKHKAEYASDKAQHKAEYAAGKAKDAADTLTTPKEFDKPSADSRDAATRAVDDVAGSFAKAADEGKTKAADVADKSKHAAKQAADAAKRNMGRSSYSSSAMQSSSTSSSSQGRERNMERAALRADETLRAAILAAENAEQKARWVREAIEETRRANEMFAASLRDVEMEARAMYEQAAEQAQRFGQSMNEQSEQREPLRRLTREGISHAAGWAREAPQDAKYTAGQLSRGEMRELDEFTQSIPPSIQDTFYQMPSKEEHRRRQR